MADLPCLFKTYTERIALSGLTSGQGVFQTDTGLDGATTYPSGFYLWNNSTWGYFPNIFGEPRQQTIIACQYPSLEVIRLSNATSGGANGLRITVQTSGDMSDGFRTGHRICIMDSAAVKNDIVEFWGQRNGGDALGMAGIAVKGPQNSGSSTQISDAFRIDYNGLIYTLFRGDTTDGFGYGHTVKYAQNSSATVSNSVAETTLATSGVGTLVFPASFFYAVRTLRIKARGYFGTTGTPTLRLRTKFGSTALCDTGAQTTSGTISNNSWELEAEARCVSVGASGTFECQGSFRYDNSNHTGQYWGMPNTSTVTIDTTAAQTFNLTAQWGTQSSSNTITCTTLTLEVLY